MSESKRPVDQALDLLVYAPLGLVLSAREMIPELAERGREQLAARVGLARLIGQFAVKQGTAEAEKAFVKAREQAMAKLGDLVMTGGTAEPPAGPGDAGASVPNPDPAPTEATPAPVVDRPRSTPVTATTPTTPVVPATPPQGSATSTAALAIPDYDSLSASQVVPRLSGLAPAELEVVRAYEEAHRGRRTVLTRVSQLQTGQ